MIKLIGVIGEGGIPVNIITYEEIKGEEEFVASLMEAINALSNVIGTGKIAKLDFMEYKMIVTDCKKGYTIVALVDAAEEFVEKLLSMIAEDIDKSDMPEFMGVVDKKMADTVAKIINKYISNMISIDVSELLVQFWSQLLETIKKNKKALKVIMEVDKFLQESAKKYEARWKKFSSLIAKDINMAIKYALEGNFSHACAASDGLTEPLEMAFHIRMGLLSLEMSMLPSPPISEIEKLVGELPQNDAFYNLIIKSLEYKLQRISLVEYMDAYRRAIKEFTFGESTEDIIRALLFLDWLLGSFPDFAKKLAKYFKKVSRPIYVYILGLVDRAKILKIKAETVQFGDFENILYSLRSKIDRLAGNINSILKHIGKLVRTGQPIDPKKNGAILKYMLGVHSYALILLTLIQSPLLKLDEKRLVLGELLKIYTKYFKKFIREGLPWPIITIANMFQSIGIGTSEVFRMLTRREKLKYLDKIENILNDAWRIVLANYSKMRYYAMFLATMTASISPILSSVKKVYIDELKLIYAIMNSFDPEIIGTWKDIFPYNYVALTLNLINTLAPLAIRILKADDYTPLLKRCIYMTLDLNRWLIYRGKPLKSLAILLPYYILRIAKNLEPNELKYLTDETIIVWELVIPDWERYDSSVALLGDIAIRLLLHVGRALNTEKYVELARRIYSIATMALRKYGLNEKYMELKSIYEKYSAKYS